MTVVDDKCQIANKTSLASLQGIKNQGGNRTPLLNSICDDKYCATYKNQLFISRSTIAPAIFK